MKEFQLNGQKREAAGKKAARLLRKEGLIPCNLYGEKKENGKVVAEAFAIPMAELRKVIYTPHIYVIDLNIDGEVRKAVMKEIQFHPVSDAVLHVDFYEVNAEKPIVMGVPVKLNGLAQGCSERWTRSHPDGRPPRSVGCWGHFSSTVMTSTSA